MELLGESKRSAKKADLFFTLFTKMNYEQMSEEELEDFLDIQKELFDPNPKVHVNVTFEEKKMLSNTLSKKGLYIIEVIGRTGISTNADLLYYVQEPKNNCPFKFSNTSISTEVKSLRENGYIIEEKIHLGSKGGYNFFSYELSNAAKTQLQEVVESERETFKKKYDSIETGYMVKHLKEVFGSLDYKINEKESFHLVIQKENGTRYVTDVHTIEHECLLFEKLDELYKNNQHLSFVVTNESILFGKFKPKLFSWITEKFGGLDGAQEKLTISFTTLQKVKQNSEKTMWETITF